MSLTREDLAAISTLLDETLDAKLDAKFKEELQPIKEDIQIMKADIETMKVDIETMKEDIETMKEDIGTMKVDIETMKSDIQTNTNDIRSIKLLQENILVPRLNTIEACYTDTYKRYKDNADRMEVAFEDIALLKSVVAEHSQKLQKLA